MIELSSIVLYPVKSCRGVTLTESAFGPDGLTHDREFLVVDAQDRFLTQRTVPRLARVETALTVEALVLRAPGLEELRVPWQFPEDGADERPVTIWRDTVRAVDAGDEAAGWFARALGQPCRLVRRGRGYARFLPDQRMPEHWRTDLPAPVPVPVAFADAFPLLIVSEESLADLNHRLDDAVPMDRFRPNLIFRGCPAPYAEDTWDVFRVGDKAVLYGGGACVRCVTTTIDQQTATPRGREPLRTLATYRRERAGGNGVIFGQNVVPEGTGQMRVGDKVEVVSAN